MDYILSRNIENDKDQSTSFAAGCSFYKLVYLFLISSFLGDIAEMIFMYFTKGRWMIRSSLVYGHFSVVWGLGCVLLTLVLYRHQNQKIRYLFFFGMVMGGLYEYICSVFTELWIGTVFWSYKKLPFNLGGRINLIHCIFWGFTAVIWMKLLYPVLSRLIERIPRIPGLIITRLIIIFMVFDIGISVLALDRYTVRRTEGTNLDSNSPIAEFLDERFPDERMKKRYPNAIFVSEKEVQEMNTKWRKRIIIENIKTKGKSGSEEA